MIITGLFSNASFEKKSELWAFRIQFIAGKWECCDICRAVEQISQHSDTCSIALQMGKWECCDICRAVELDWAVHLISYTICNIVTCNIVEAVQPFSHVTLSHVTLSRLYSPFPKRWDPKWSLEYKLDSRMLKVHVSFQMNHLKRDIWWEFWFPFRLPYWVASLSEMVIGIQITIVSALRWYFAGDEPFEKIFSNAIWKGLFKCNLKRSFQMQ